MVTPPAALTARTREIPADDPRAHVPLLQLLPDRSAVSWVRDGAGLVGWGVAARYETAGQHRFHDADTWWHELCAAADVDDELGLPGTGPVAFSSFAFADRPGRSVVVVPRVVVGSRDGVRWITTIGEQDATGRQVQPVAHPGEVRFHDGRLTPAAYRDAVASAVEVLRAPGELRKVVLAHDLLATTGSPVDPRFLLGELAHRYPSCWTFAVDGLVGATPELLLERTGSRVRSQVLAGTCWPRPGASADELAAGLLDSAKDRIEHAFAAESVAAELRPFCGELAVPEHPEVLRLRNVLHLASRITGRLHEHAASNRAGSLLQLGSALHPTAAVGGTPTAAAVELIGRLERMDRGRYAGPVGWLDAAGNGELGIALRCAQIERPAPTGDDLGAVAGSRAVGSGAAGSGTAGSGAASSGAAGSGADEGSAAESCAAGDGAAEGGGRVRMFAGGGIVADSDPDMEVAEAAAKLRPMREALLAE